MKDQGGPYGGTTMPWADHIQSWTDSMIVEGLSPDTIALRRYQVVRLADAYTHLKPWSLTTADLITWMAARPWSRETRRSFRSAIRSFYAWAVRMGHIDRSPADLLPPVRKPAHLPRPVPDQVYASALDGATDQLRLVLLLLGYQGLRIGEVARLHRDDVDGRTLRVRGKGDKERLLPLHPLVAGEIEAELARRAEGRRGTGYRYATGIHEGWLLPGRYGGHITPDGVGRMVKRVVGDGWSAHKIRHLFACRVYERTHDIAVVSTLLGHASLTTTQIYTKIPNAFIRDAVNTL